VADAGDVDDPEAVEVAAALGLLDDREVREVLGDEDGVDRVVDAPGGAQPEHVPVVDQRGLLDGQHEDARLAGALHHTQRVDEAGVLDGGGEAPGAAEHVAAVLGHRGARAGALARDHREALAAEDLVDRLVAEVRAAGPDGQRGRHRDPAGRCIGVRELLDHLERPDRIELGAAERAGDPHPEDPCRVQRVDHLVGERAPLVAVRAVLVDERLQAARLVEEVRSGRGALGHAVSCVDAAFSRRRGCGPAPGAGAAPRRPVRLRGP
jgi:hypothetical protein